MEKFFSSEWLLRLLNLMLRALSMGSKLVLVVIMAHYLPAEDVGLYGLFSATIAFSVILVGGEYYTYSQREMLSTSREEWKSILGQQSLAIFLLYIFCFPLLGLLFIFDYLPCSLVTWFFLLLVAEHVAQELNRILVAMHKQLWASVVLFFRLGAWVWVVLGFYWVSESSRTVSVVLTSWLFGSLFAVALGCYPVFKAIGGSTQNRSINYKDLFRGYRTAAFFFFSTLAFRGMMTVDRFVVERFLGGDMLGVYVVFSSISMAVNSVLVPTVFSFLYPRLVESYRKHEFKRYIKIRNEMIVSVILVGGGVAVLVGLLSPLVFSYVGKEIYIENIETLWVLLVVSFLYCVTMIPHYVLYAKGRDRFILTSHAVGITVFAMLLTVRYGQYNLSTVAWFLVLSVLSIGFVKIYGCYAK